MKLHEKKHVEFFMETPCDSMWNEFAYHVGKTYKNSKSNQTQIYLAPYIASESEALRLRLDRIVYVKQYTLWVTLKTRNTGASSAVMRQIVPDAWGIYTESSVTQWQSAEWYCKQKSIRRAQSSCGSVLIKKRCYAYTEQAVRRALKVMSASTSCSRRVAAKAASAASDVVYRVRWRWWTPGRYTLPWREHFASPKAAWNSGWTYHTSSCYSNRAGRQRFPGRAFWHCRGPAAVECVAVRGSGSCIRKPH